MVSKLAQGMPRSLYFTWDQLMGLYLNTHSALAAERSGDLSYARFD